jgi:hypothetical protein
MTATESHLSTLATTGTRVTRVSAMRLRAVRPDRIAPQSAMVAGHAAPLRSMGPGPLITNG